MHSELVAHSDHCQTLVFSSRPSGKKPSENRSLAYQDDDDYWERTTKLIDDLAASVAADLNFPEPPKAATTDSMPATSNGAVREASNQPSLPSNGATQGEQPSATSAGASAPVELDEQLRADIDKLKEFVSQKVAAREAEVAKASLPPTQHPPPAPIDQTVQNLYLLNKATQSQQPPHTPRGSATPQTQPPTPSGGHHLPMQGPPQGHMPHLPCPTGVAAQTPGATQHSGSLAPGELPPNQTCPTSMLYDKARQAALSKSATHTRREGIHSTRRPWTPEEEKALMTGLDMVKGPHWSQILSLFGPNGTISDVLKDRTQVQLKDKARNLKLFFLKTQSEMPYYLSAVTGELKTRAPNQAARKEAEERARLSREGEKAQAQGTAALAGQLASASQAAAQGDLARQQQQQTHDQKQQPHQQQPQQQHQHPHHHQHAGVVTPAQAALAAHITTPAMAQGQAQSAQRPVQAAQPPATTMPAKEAQAPAPVSAPMVTPSPAPTQGGAVSAPAAQSQSQPHNRPSDGTVAALQELAKASASPVSAAPTSRMQSQGLAQGQPQAQARTTPSGGPSGQNQGQGQMQGQAQAQVPPQAQPTQQAAVPQPPSQPQPQPQASAQPQAQQSQPHARVSASPGISTQASPATATPAVPATKTATPSPAPPAQEQQPATTSGTAPTASTATKAQAPAAASTKLPASTPGPTTSSSTPATSALSQLRNGSTPVTLSQSFPSTIPANLFSRVTEAEATNAGLLEKLRAEMAKEARS